MTTIKVNYSGHILNGSMNVRHRQSGNSVTTVNQIEIVKSKESITFFMGWPPSQGVNFDCGSSGSADYFLIDETPTHYIFETR